jgi:hypothetical protein
MESALEKAARLLMESIEAEARLQQPKVKALLRALAEPKGDGKATGDSLGGQQAHQRPPEGQRGAILRVEG